MDIVHAVLRAGGSRNAGLDEGLELHGVEMSPGSLVGMILERTSLSTFRTTARFIGVALQADFDALGFEIEVDGLNQPVCFETEQQGVMLVEIVHAAMLLRTSVKNHRQAPSHNNPRRADIVSSENLMESAVEVKMTISQALEARLRVRLSVHLEPLSIRPSLQQ